MIILSELITMKMIRNNSMKQQTFWSGIINS